MSAAGIEAGVARLRADGSGEEVVAAFRHYAGQLAAGATGLLREADIEPVQTLPDADELPDPGPQAGELLDATVVIKLNGGLGTSMGMTRAKSLLEVKVASASSTSPRPRWNACASGSRTLRRVSRSC